MSLKTWILDLLYPPKCPYCRTILSNSRDLLCAHCQESLPWRKEHQSKWDLNFTEGCYSVFFYEEKVREAILRYKFMPMPAYGRPMGILLAQCVQDHEEIQPDFVTWAPLHPKRRRRRGFDQAELLAKEAGNALGLPVYRTLEKRKNTLPQSKQEGERARQKNTVGAYAKSKHAPPLEGKSILLVDDVVTSGATLAECARILRMEGSKSVWCVTVARAGKNIEKNG